MHIKCEGITERKYEIISKLDDYCWTCRVCCAGNLPLAHTATDELNFGQNLEQQRTLGQVDLSDVDFSKVIESSRLKMLLININELLSKLDFIKLLAEKLAFDTLSLNETKLDESIKDEDVQIPGYLKHRNDRDKHGGGVALYVSKKFEVYKQEKWEQNDIEAVWVKLCLKRSRPIVLGSIYRPPRN